MGTLKTQVGLAASVAAFLLLLLVLVLARLSGAGSRASATVVLNGNDRNDVVLGQDIVVDIDNVPSHWSGTISVNSTRRFRLDSTHFLLSATVANGFKRAGANDLTVLLQDDHGTAIPIAGSSGSYRFVTIPNVILHPEVQNVEGEGSARAVLVEDRSGYRWGVSHQPDWVTILPGAAGTEDGKIDYVVQKNPTNEARTAQLKVGDAVFEIRQRAPVAIQLPFRETFSSDVLPAPVWMMRKRDEDKQFEVESRWFIEEQAGRHSTLAVEPGGPGHSNSLVIESHQADPHTWASQIQLPGLDLTTNVTYVLSLSLKAEVPGPVSFGLMQRTPPYQGCGLFEFVTITHEWTQFTKAFQVSGIRCGAENNELSLQIGRISGKLWLASVSLIQQPRVPSVAGRQQIVSRTQR